MPIKQAQAKLYNAVSDRGLESITLMTFKKDRSITLRRVGDSWELVEKGFENVSIPINAPKDRRAIKEAFKREFPRSTRAYVGEDRV